MSFFFNEISHGLEHPVRSFDKTDAVYMDPHRVALLIDAILAGKHEGGGLQWTDLDLGICWGATLAFYGNKGKDDIMVTAYGYNEDFMQAVRIIYGMWNTRGKIYSGTGGYARQIQDGYIIEPNLGMVVYEPGVYHGIDMIVPDRYNFPCGMDVRLNYTEEIAMRVMMDAYKAFLQTYCLLEDNTRERFIKWDHYDENECMDYYITDSDVYFTAIWNSFRSKRNQHRDAVDGTMAYSFHLSNERIKYFPHYQT